MIDIESILLAEQKQNQALAVEQIRDASSKWIAKLPKWMAQTLICISFSVPSI